MTLAPSCVAYNRLNAEVAHNDQRTILHRDNLLRPKKTLYAHCDDSTSSQHWNYNLNANPELGRRQDDDQACLPAQQHCYGQFGADRNAAPQLPAQNETGRQAWIASPDDDLDVHLYEADQILAARLAQKLPTSQNMDAVMLRENDTTAIDCHQYSATLISREPIYADNQYKGTIQPNLTADEAHAGQRSDCVDASSGFESDGNCVIPFTNITLE